MILCFSYYEMFESRSFLFSIYLRYLNITFLRGRFFEQHSCTGEPRAQPLCAAQPGAKMYCTSECRAHNCASDQFGALGVCVVLLACLLYIDRRTTYCSSGF